MGKKNVIADCFYISSLLFLMPLKKLILPLFTGILKEDRNNKVFELLRTAFLVTAL